MQYELVIVGGGPAGLATALFLGAVAPRLLERVVVLEREHYPREKICAGAIGARAERYLERIGVKVEVPSVSVRGLCVVSEQGRIVERTAEPIGRVVRRVEFDHALAQVARARGVRVLEGTRVTEVKVEQGGVRLETSQGELRARAVVGADGVGSFVRRALGVPRGRWLAQVAEVDTPAVPSDEARDLLLFDITDRALPGYAWDFPTLVRGEPMFCRGAYCLRPEPGVPGMEDAPDVSAVLRARLEQLGAVGGPAKRFAERGLSPHEPVAQSRALLVGEAAGIDPALGEGIAQALCYGAVAGPYLARCLERDALDFADWRGVLRRSAVGMDLEFRTRITPFLYGRTRSIAQRWVGGSRSLAAVGIRYFGGARVPARGVARTVLSLAGAAVRERLEGRAFGGAQW